MKITRTAHLPVSPDEAWSLLTEPERLRRWQAVSAFVDLRAGGSYRWTIAPGHVAAGTYREVEPGRRLVFGFGWDGTDDLPPDASVVTVTVEPTEDGCVVTLVHDGLAAEQTEPHGDGWTHYLSRLTAVATDGTAGPDPMAWDPEPLDPVVAAEAVLAAVQPVLRGLPGDAADRPTPCADFTCAELLDHLVTSLERLAAMAGAPAHGPDAGGEPYRGGSAEDRVSVAAAEAVEAWRARGLEGTVDGPGGQATPASFLAAILPVELLLHGWDLAQGSGQQLAVSDEVVAYVRSLAADVVPGGRGRAFGDEVVPPPDADPLGRLAAFAGRRPSAA